MKITVTKRDNVSGMPEAPAWEQAMMRESYRIDSAHYIVISFYHTNDPVVGQHEHDSELAYQLYFETMYSPTPGLFLEDSVATCKVRESTSREAGVAEDDKRSGKQLIHRQTKGASVPPRIPEMCPHDSKPICLVNVVALCERAGEVHR